MSTMLNTVCRLTFLSRNTRNLLSVVCDHKYSVLRRQETSSSSQSVPLKEGRHFRAKIKTDLSGTTSEVRTNLEAKKPHKMRQVNIKNIFKEHNSSVNCLEVGSTHVDTEQEDQDVAPGIILDSESLKDFKSKLADSENFQYSHEDWERLKGKTLSENPHLRRSWETLCMQLMYHYGQASLATSFIDYLNKGSCSPNLSSLCLFVALQGKHGNEDKEHIVEETYQRILKMTDVFDSITAKYLIVGLSCTAQWRQSLNILEMVKLTTSPGRSYYSPIVAAAIREQDTDLAFELLDEMALKGLVPQNTVLQEILHTCQSAGSHDLLERYFTCVWKNSWILSPSAAQEVELYFTRSLMEKWTCKWTSVNTVRGVCHQCKHGLDRIELSTSDFEAMQREFLERALVRDNVYLHSSPEEVERFRDFVMENAPFDIVLDALNIALKGQGKTSAQKSKQLRGMVHYFAREHHLKVLVIGRAHMKNWPAADMTYISKQAKTFFTDNISSDDPFCLYATLYSGKDCLFVSGDFMRNHKYSMGPQFKEIFQRWQKSRQIVNFISQPTGVSIVMPSQYDCGPVKHDKGWHIPYDDGNSDLRSGTQAVLCLRCKGGA